MSSIASSPLRRIGLYAGTWLVLASFFASQTLLFPRVPQAPSRLVYFSATLADWLIWAVLTPFIIPLAKRYPFDRERWPRALAVHFFAAIGFAFTKVLLRWAVGQIIPAIPTPPRIRGVLLGQGHISFATYWVIAITVMAVEYYRRFRERERRTTQLETRLAQVQLEALKTQLHPHFLFNTLHAISALVRDGQSEAANRAISRLAELLRLTLDAGATHEIPLEQELAFLERYLELQQMRFADRLNVRLDVAPNTLHLAVPTLLLQPLVENAIRHGISARTSGGTLSIAASTDGSALRLIVRDDGPGLSPGYPPEGLGIKNTRARLEQLYGDDHYFSLDSAPGGGLAVTIILPARSAPRIAIPDRADLAFHDS